jgi:two-component system response regulator FixJ
LVTTVCIIEDDEDLREVLARVVRSAGLTAAPYDSAESFLERSDDFPIGCMLVDVHLRGLNGIALLEKLAEGNLGCPVFLISGAHGAVTAAAAKRLGAVIIDKPFNVHALAHSILTAVSEAAR